MGKGQESSGKANQITTPEGNFANGTNEKEAVPRKVQKKNHQQKSCLHRNAFVVTMILSTMLDGLAYAVSSQYRYHFFRDQYQDQLSKYNATQAGACSSDDLDSEVKDIEDEITKQTTRWTLYENYAIMVPLFIASLVIGMKSDQIGRRFLFILPIVVSSFFNVYLAVIIKLKIHYGWLLIGSFITACCGGNISMFYASFAIISDGHGKAEAEPKEITVTPDNPNIQDQDKEQKKTQLPEPKNVDDDGEIDMSREQARTYKIVALDVSRRIASSLVSFATGYVIEYAGYFYTLVIVIGLDVVLLIIAYVFVTESDQQKKNEGFKAPLRIIGKAIKDPLKGPTLILCNVGLFFLIFGLVEDFEIIRIYQMSPPFCFNSVKLGWLSSEARLKGLFSIPLMWFWKKLHFSEATIAAVGMLSSSASGLLLATVRHVWVFYTVPVIGIPGSLVLSVTKAITSRLVGRTALASTFAVMIAGEEVGYFIGSIASNNLYQHFVSTAPTAPFYMGSASFAVGAFLFAIMALRQRRLSRRVTTDTENNQESNAKM